HTLRQVAALFPYGQPFADGLFVGGDPGPGLVPPDPTPVVTVTATTPDTLEGSSTPGVLTFTRTGDTSADLAVKVPFGGTASGGLDYTSISLVVLPAGQASTTVNVSPIDDSAFENTETVVATVQAAGGYTVGSPSVAVVSIADNDGPPPLVP